MANNQCILTGKRDWRSFHLGIRIQSAQYWKYWDPAIDECDRPAPPRNPGDLRAYIEKLDRLQAASSSAAGTPHSPVTPTLDVEKPASNSGGLNPDLASLRIHDPLGFYKYEREKYNDYEEANSRAMLYIVGHVSRCILNMLSDLPNDCRVVIPHLYKIYKTDPQEERYEASAVYYETLAKFDARNLDSWLDDWVDAVCMARLAGAVTDARWLSDLAQLLEEPMPSMAANLHKESIGVRLVGIRQEDSQGMRGIVRWASEIRVYLLHQREDEAKPLPVRGPVLGVDDYPDSETDSTAGSARDHDRPQQHNKRSCSASVDSNQQPAPKRGRGDKRCEVCQSWGHDMSGCYGLFDDLAPRTFPASRLRKLQKKVAANLHNNPDLQAKADRLKAARG